MKKTSQLPQRNLIGERVRKARLACNPAVTQEDLAGRLAARGISVDQTAISRIENQTRYLMDYEIVALAKSLRVSVAYLFGESNKLNGRLNW
jgi:transcriptional regulator with XRE-family HTH domain